MNILTKNICDIVTVEAKTIDVKVSGLNFLESLKINLVDRLLPLINELKFPLEQVIDFHKDIEETSRIINISINYYINSISITKKIIEEDSLFISFSEISNFDIFKDDKNFKSIPLYKNTGISLPKDTLINLKLNNNVLLLEIKYKDKDQVLKI